MLKFSEDDTTNFNIDAYFGLITCIILPPDILHLPVLPMRHNEKLFFPLCTFCMKNSIKDFCNHSDKERSLRGTWGIPEVKLAIKFGYKILR